MAKTANYGDHVEFVRFTPKQTPIKERGAVISSLGEYCRVEYSCRKSKSHWEGRISEIINLSEQKREQKREQKAEASKECQ